MSHINQTIVSHWTFMRGILFGINIRSSFQLTSMAFSTIFPNDRVRAYSIMVSLSDTIAPSLKMQEIPPNQGEIYQKAINVLNKKLLVLFMTISQCHLQRVLFMTISQCYLQRVLFMTISQRYLQHVLFMTISQRYLQWVLFMTIYVQMALFKVHTKAIAHGNQC